MLKFIVEVREVHIQGYEIEAETEEQAKDLIREGNGDLIDGHFEYSHTLDSEFWTVEKKEE